jgi:hypothetical protein
VHVILGNLVVIVLMTKLIPGVRLARRLWNPMLSGAAAGGVGYLTAGWVHGGLSFVAAVVGTLLAFTATHLFLDYRGLREALSLVPSRQHELPGAFHPESQPKP